MGAGCVTWSIGSVAWVAYDVTLGHSPSFPSWADVGYLGYAIPIAVAVLRFPRAARGPWSRWRLLLDGMVIAGSLLLTSLVLVLGPVLDSTSSTFARWVALAYPLTDVLVASLVVTRCMVFPRARRRVWVTLSAGLLVLSLTDSLYVAASFAADFTPGGLVDLGYFASFVLVALAARAPNVDAPHIPRSPVSEPASMAQQLLPYAAIGIALTAYLSRPDAVASHGRFLWLVLPLLAAIAVRQVVVVGDHAAVARDLSSAVDRRTAQLKHREQWWRDLVQNLSDVVVVVGTDGQVRYCSPSVRAVLGHWPQHLTTAVDLRTMVHPDDASTVLASIAPVLEGTSRQGFTECRLRRADGEWGWFELSAVGQLSEAALEGAVLTLHDVSERRDLTDRLTHQAHHDALTGLPNRSMLMSRLEKALVRRAGQPFALMMVDLDDFKVINDRHGHAAGDLVLEVIGRRLEKIVGAQDTVARLGGDEFALLVTGTAEHVRTVASRLTRHVARPVVAGGRRFLVHGSVGVVFASADDTETPHSLLSHADIALYEAKAHHKGGVVVIEGSERAAAATKVHLREQIAEPDLEQFHVVYQPIIELSSGRMRGVEALLRWEHPDLGSVSPEDFIPMAEHGGSIEQLGWHVLAEACRQLVRWDQECPGHRLAMGVNVSSRQIDQPGFADGVLALIADHGLEPDLLVLELTEQSLAVDFETAVTVVAELRAGGVSVAVDDYGTGYSSLSYLHRFDADVVKIDRSFIANLQDSLHTQKIVGSVIDMAGKLDLQTIAEGIETPAQLELVRELGCELGQGFLFSRPVAPHGITELLAHRPADADLPAV
jgi:diguanylate cyclase (GGDEF)-like protein/PAS domain S-box-containing protein